ncbi:MAG: hypothetical protein GEU73_01180 [Chloroflexi bacterium]|nr:hypothetical protein [Chloroflexota bacterium]
MGPLQLEGFASVVLDAADLRATREFYSLLFGSDRGQWREHGRRVTFVGGDQSVEFVRHPRPRTLAHAGQHVGYRIPRAEIGRVADSLAASGFEVNRWHEDHPSERDTTPYAKDPSGNIVELVPSDHAGTLIDHYYVPVEDIEHAELFYLNALRGQLDTYFGYSTADVSQAHRWSEGKDSAAPWTRNAYVSFRTHEPNPTPAAQVFTRFGEGYVGVTLTGQRLPEPPEEFLKYTPRLVFRSSHAPHEVASYLASVRISPVSLRYDGGRIRFRREGRDIFLRDRSGNFFQIACAG